MRVFHPPVIVIGGIDPSGGAGITADLEVLQTFKIRAFSVTTAVTAQNEQQFLSYQAVSLQTFSDQLQSLKNQASGAFVKIGMFANSQFLPLLLSFFEQCPPKFILWDPVFQSSTAGLLIETGGAQHLKQHLLGVVDLVTPNLPEAQFLAGVQTQKSSIEEMEVLGKNILAQVAAGARLQSVLIKGGHALEGDEVVDVLVGRSQSKIFKASRILTKGVHGTGCTLGASVIACLALGENLETAIEIARRKVREKINDHSS